MTALVKIVVASLVCGGLLFGALPAFAADEPQPATFDAIGREALATGAAPGIALAVAYKGTIAYEGGFGFANVAKKRRASARTPFAIGSVTKQFTAAAIIMLADEGKLSLDDALSKYEPQLPNAGRITIRMLLDQTSGLHNYPLLAEHPWPTHGAISLSEILAILATDKPDFSPGSKWEYSNANYTVLAAIVEKASGKPYSEFVRTRIFEPLHMTDSGIGYAAQQDGRLAVGYVNSAAETPPLSLDLFSGAGGMISSAHDLALWDVALMRGTLLPASYLAGVAQQAVPTNEGTTRYANGWVVTSLDGHLELWHNGVAPGAGGYCLNAIFPDEGLAIAILTNGFRARGVPEGMVSAIAADYGIGAPAPSPAPATTAAPGDDPAIDAIARAFWDQLAAGTIDRSKLAPQFSQQLTPALLAQVQQGIAQLGQLRAFTFAGRTTANGLAIYRYSLLFADGSEHEWDVAIGAGGTIAGSRLVR